MTGTRRKEMRESAGFLVAKKCLSQIMIIGHPDTFLYCILFNVLKVKCVHIYLFILINRDLGYDVS